MRSLSLRFIIYTTVRIFRPILYIVLIILVIGWITDVGNLEAWTVLIGIIIPCVEVVINKFAPRHDDLQKDPRYLNELISSLKKEDGVLEYVDLAVQSVQNSDSPARKIKTIQQAIAKFEHFVLVGKTGVGKTTALRHLALQVAEARLQDEQTPPVAPLPLVLYLSNWKDGQTLANFIRANGRFQSDPLKTIGTGNVFLYLDGLNEMGAAASKKARQLKKWLHGPNAPFRAIITCREDDYTDDLDLGLQ